MADTKALATSATTHIFSSCKLTIPTSIIFLQIYVIFSILSVKWIVQIKNWIELNWIELDLILCLSLGDGDARKTRLIFHWGRRIANVSSFNLKNHKLKKIKNLTIVSNKQKKTKHTSTHINVIIYNTIQYNTTYLLWLLFTRLFFHNYVN